MFNLSKLLHAAEAALTHHSAQTGSVVSAAAATDLKTAIGSVETAGVAIVKEAADAAVAKLPFGAEAGEIFNGFIDDVVAEISGRKHTPAASEAA